MIRLDAAFHIGEAHMVCHDYALAAPADAPGTPYPVLLSDGCSTSPHTDIGARLLVHQMRLDLPRFAPRLTLCAEESPQSIADGAISRGYRRAVRMARRLGLPDGCLDATLLGLVAIPDDTGTPASALYTLMYGDGAAAYGRRDGSLVVLECAYPAGYPFYPAYLASAERYERWRRVEGNAQTLTRTVISADGVVLDVQRIIPDTPRFLFRTDPVELAELTFAAVFSDGVQSFLRETEGSGRCPVPCSDVVRELTAFKSFAGIFAHRRLRRFREDAAARGWSHHDDLSIAAISFDRGTEGA